MQLRAASHSACSGEARRNHPALLSWPPVKEHCRALYLQSGKDLEIPHFNFSQCRVETEAQRVRCPTEVTSQRCPGEVPKLASELQMCVISRVRLHNSFTIVSTPCPCPSLFLCPQALWLHAPAPSLALMQCLQVIVYHLT